MICLITELTSIGQLLRQWKCFSMTKTRNSESGERVEYFNKNLNYNQQWHELLIFEYLGSEVKQVWHVAREIIISLMTIFIGSKIIF